ncbi:MAG TPA: DUF6015 family protein, partial [Candidatus Thermoplasmatota archaeon]|nr:DUF6015 family protein [Candidatus Thermoplasmatota archaeon]
MQTHLAPSDLALALHRLFGMDDEDAGAIAEVVLDHFSGKEEVDDDDLAPDVRSIFYTLEGKKLLTFRRDEYTTEDGDRRRAFFWRLRHEEVLAARGEKAQAVEMD